MNILFINVGRRVELVQAFRKAGATVYGTDIDSNAPALSFCAEHIILPKKNWIDPLAEYCETHEISLVIPTIDPDLMRLQAHRERLPQILMSSNEALNICDNKRKSKRCARDAGLSVALEEDPNRYEGELFQKPICGSASKGAGTIQCPAPAEPGMMYERIMVGDEVTVDVFCGRIAIARKRLRVRDGEVSRSIIERNDRLEKQSMLLAREIGCTGPVTVQFKGGIFLEINARMGGGLPLTIAAGGCWPEMIMSRPNIPLVIQDGLRMDRYDQSIFSMPKKAYIFDLDDTLYLEQDYVFAGYRAVADRVYRESGREVEGQLRGNYLLGNRSRVFDWISEDEDYRKALIDIYRNNAYELHHCVDVDVLRVLRHQGHKVALLTNGPRSNKLARLSLDPVFDEVVYDAGKPSDSVFLSLCKRLGVSPYEAYYIGDNPDIDNICQNYIRIRRHCGEHYSKIYKGKTISSLRELL